MKFDKPTYDQLEVQVSELSDQLDFFLSKLNLDSSSRDDLFRLIVENSKDGINVLDLASGKYIYMNYSQVELTGFSYDEIINITAEEAFDRLHPEDRSVSMEQQKQIVAGHDVIDPVEYRWKVKSGAYRWFNDRRTLVRDEKGMPVALIGVSRDITDRKRQELQIQQLAKKLEQLNHDKDKFISILAHDLKDPFNTLLGFTDLLLNNLHHYDEHMMKAHLQRIYDTALHTHDLVDEILLWARSRSGDLRPEPVTFPFIEIVQELIDSHHGQAREKNITIQTSDPYGLTLKADVNVFRTVLRNLLLNAIKFTGHNGEINIAGEKENGRAIISVSDNGVGIEEDVIPKLWDISVHHTTAGTHHEKGTGFGLKLCKELIEKNGGKIWVQSEPGKGSTFKFTMPAG
ncbi:MAG TPA: PAS domain-containing sensor histidine kinase [Phnomibacter sp.]|nr:PAS domain-containing sensor histidine kinase [Phnomibacter sp.]